MLPDRESLLFELTMPSVAEELVLRGVFQSLLNETFGRWWRFGGAQFSWGALITAALFTIAHAAVFGRISHLMISIAGAIPAAAVAGLLGWVRERAGGV
jgi:membrane protease YdiL (CAAX protease family)